MREERKRQLRQQALLGDKAKLISDFANDTLADAQDYVLKRLLDKDVDLWQLQADYRAAMAFWQKIENTIAIGRDAASKLKKMEENENE